MLGTFIQRWVFNPNKIAICFYLSSQRIFWVDGSLIMNNWTVLDCKFHRERSISEISIYFTKDSYIEETNLSVLYKAYF